jgi:ppGpp synthetase/RelA/SpoT-type nucleotidyltranferase
VFSGDLTFQGAPSEFQQGTEWLSKLVEGWQTKLFVVPGNHDITRGQAHLILRLADADEKIYSHRREDLKKQLQHLDSFRNWHGNAKSVFGDSLISDWSDPFGCHALIATNNPQLRIIGLNTALLSCGDDDLCRLVQDIPTLNNLLAKRSDEYDCVVAVGHHPLSWLRKWNQEEVERLLKQETGANIYLHGHRHEQSAAAFATATGQSLCTLECGAAYQGSRWPQYFTFYRFDFNNREIGTRVLLYSPNSGEWVYDGGLSRAFVGPIPKLRAAEPGGPESSDSASSVVAAEGIVTSASQNYSNVPDSELLGLFADHAIANAQIAQRAVDIFLNSDPYFTRAEYSKSSRIKEHDQIIKKVLRRREEGANNFRVEDVTDVCGFRYITLYQSSIPLIVDRLLRSIPPGGPPHSPFCREGGVEIEVHTSRHENDPLSVVNKVRETVARWDKGLKVQERQTKTGYSSVHLIVRCRILRRGQPERHVPVEFQIRNILEEVWGQLDHKLRYETGRGIVGGEPRLLHLNVLKAQFDACIQYMDLIKAQSQEREASSTRELAGSRQTIDSPQKELERLQGLPITLLHQVEEAYELWKQADASRQVGGEPGLYRKAADAFSSFVNGCPTEVRDAELSGLLSYTARLERAYLLMFTGAMDELIEAREIYENIIKEKPKDATVHFRLGQVLRRQSYLDEAIGQFQQSINIIEGHDDWRLRPNEGWVYDFARLSLGFAYFRRFERKDLAHNERDAAIGMAIDWTEKVLQHHTEPDAGRRAVNNLLYYAWEERSFHPDGSKWRVSETRFRELVAQLDSSGSATSYEQLDTLARAYHRLGDGIRARAFADKVCEWLENAAMKRSGGTLSLPEPRPTFQWMGRVMAYLTSDDERDALAFALDLSERVVDPEGEPVNVA